MIINCVFILKHKSLAEVERTTFGYLSSEVRGRYLPPTGHNTNHITSGDTRRVQVDFFYIFLEFIL